MIDVRQTLQAQFANSVTLTALIDSINAYIDPSVDFDLFYNGIWNQLADGATLTDYGLDVWGRIVGVTRTVNLASDTPNPGGYAFTPGAYRLDNAGFRTLILVKALANITNCTADSINKLLSILFASRGRCYVIDSRDMAMQYVFEFYLQPYEYVIITASGAVPRPMGVEISVVQIDVPNTFGFAEQINLQPFDQGTFYSG